MDVLSPGMVYIRLTPLDWATVPRTVSESMNRQVYFDKFTEFEDVELQGQMHVRYRRFVVRVPVLKAELRSLEHAGGDVFSRGGFSPLSEPVAQQWARALFKRPSVNGFFLDSLGGEGVVVVEDNKRTFASDDKGLITSLKYSHSLKSRVSYEVDAKSGLYGDFPSSVTPSFMVGEIVKVGEVDDVDFAKGPVRMDIGSPGLSLMRISSRGSLYFKPPK